MAIAFDATSVKEYSLENDTDEPKTVFLLGSLDHKLAPYINDKWLRLGVSSKDADEDANTIITHSGKRDAETVKFGLKGWRNLKDKSGNEIQFRPENVAVPGVGMRSCASDSSMDAVKPFIEELAKVIRDDNYLSASQVKN